MAHLLDPIIECLDPGLGIEVVLVLAATLTVPLGRIIAAHAGVLRMQLCGSKPEW